MVDEGVLIGGRYRVDVRLGSGAMGVVWRAQDELLERTVAVKQLLQHSGLSEAELEESNRRAVREGRMAARLLHPHATAVYDVVQHEGHPCLIMEHLQSTSLATILGTRGALPVDEVTSIGRQIASALSVAHEKGIVHRDVKPGNVLVTEDGVAKITDFGISRALGDVTASTTGVLLGTPAYLAPEVAQGNSAGYAADVFSFGSTLYAAVEGEPPFGLDTNAIAQLHRVASGEITPPRQAGELSPLLLRLLQPSPEQRPTMSWVQEALTAMGRGQAPPETGADLPEQAPESIAVSAPPTAEEAAPLPVVSAESPGTARREEVGDLPVPGEWTEQASQPKRRKRSALLAAAGTLALLAAAVVAVIASDGQPPGGNAAQQNPPPRQETPPPPAPGTASQVTTQAGPTSQVSPPAGQAQPSPPAATPEPMQAVIPSYYALLPGNLAEGWNRLTDNYKRAHVQSFEEYQQFWAPVERVEVPASSATPGGGAEATVRYVYKNGRVVEERISYGLVFEAGLWKIDRSTVQQSRTVQGS